MGCFSSKRSSVSDQHFEGDSIGGPYPNLSPRFPERTATRKTDQQISGNKRRQEVTPLDPKPAEDNTEAEQRLGPRSQVRPVVKRQAQESDNRETQARQTHQTPSIAEQAASAGSAEEVKASVEAAPVGQPRAPVRRHQPYVEEEEEEEEEEY